MADPTYTFRLSQHGLDLDKSGQHARTWASACRAATTANIAISTALNAGDTLDGVTLAAGDRVLVKDQSTGSQNGIYIVGPTPARAEDYDTSAQIVGSMVVVSEGTANADTVWQCTTNGPVTVGTTALVFTGFGITAHTSDTTDAHDASAISFDDSVASLGETDVQGAIEALDAAVAGGGHSEDHDHDGSPTQKLAQANTHESPDTDTDPTALHHTLGSGADQAAAGDHTHAGGSEWDVEIIKATDDSATNVSSQDDSELFFTVAGAGEVWLIDLLVIYSGDSSTADFRQNIACSAGTMRGVFRFTNLNTSDTIQNLGVAISDTNTAGPNGYGTDAADSVRLGMVTYFIRFSAACTFKVQFGQGTPTIGKTAKLRTGSTLRARQLV